MGYFGEQKYSQPCIQSWGVRYFLQVARTAAQHCMTRVREGFIFLFLGWQNARDALYGKKFRAILSPIVVPHFKQNEKHL